MPYGSYDGPEKANKGLEGGACNRSLCQGAGANWYNHGSYAWYCHSCKNAIYDDWAVRNWVSQFSSTGHPMFETRQMIDDRVNNMKRHGLTRGARFALEIARALAGEFIIIPTPNQQESLATMDWIAHNARGKLTPRREWLALSAPNGGLIHLVSNDIQIRGFNYHGSGGLYPTNADQENRIKRMEW